MAIQVTLSFDSEADLIAYFMRDKKTPPAVIQMPTKPVATPAPVIEKAYAAAAEPLPNEEDEPFEEPTPANDNPTAEDVTAALTAFGKAKGAVALKAVLDQVGAKRVSEIQPDQFAAVLAAVKG
jgi:hypothetical protein